MNWNMDHTSGLFILQDLNWYILVTKALVSLYAWSYTSRRQGPVNWTPLSYNRDGCPGMAVASLKRKYRYFDEIFISLRAALDVVILTTCSAASDGNVIKKWQFPEQPEMTIQSTWRHISNFPFSDHVNGTFDIIYTNNCFKGSQQLISNQHCLDQMTA